MIDPLAAELLSVITLAMSCRDPRVGMALLGDGVGVVLLGRGEGEAPRPEPTELRPLTDDDEPLDWDFADPRMQAVMRPEYRETAEYHYAMAERERALREGE